MAHTIFVSSLGIDNTFFASPHLGCTHKSDKNSSFIPGASPAPGTTIIENIIKCQKFYSQHSSDLEPLENCKEEGKGFFWQFFCIRLYMDDIFWLWIGCVGKWQLYLEANLSKKGAWKKILFYYWKHDFALHFWVD